MAKRTPSKPSPEEIKAQREAEVESQRAILTEQSHRNPHMFFPFGECGLILGFSGKAMGKLNAAGCPVAFRKMNPGMVCQWIRENPEKMAKMSEEDENS